MMKNILVVSFLFFCISPVYAQDIATSTSAGVIYLYANEANVNLKDYKRGSFSGPHILGEEIDEKLNRFEYNYVYYKNGEGAYAVEEKHVLKPNIYKAVNRLVKHYTKQFKKGKISGEEARQSVSNALEIGNKLIKFQTDKVEYDLDKIKNVDTIEKYLTKIQFREEE